MITHHNNEQIHSLIETLSHSARLAQGLSLDDTARLLAMALLDLQTKLHSISPHELRSFTRTVANVVEFKVREPANDSKPAEAVGSGHHEQMPFAR